MYKFPFYLAHIVVFSFDFQRAFCKQIMAQNDLNSTISTNYTHMLDEIKLNVANTDEDWSIETLQRTRYIIQRIIVPIVVTIGIAGNLLTVIVLTR